MADEKEYSCTLKVTDFDGRSCFEGKARLSLGREFLGLHATGGEDYLVRYRDLDGLLDENYTVLLATAQNRFIISMLGKFYNGVLKDLRRLRRDDTIIGLLLDDFREIDEFSAKYAHLGGGGEVIARGDCDLLVFDRAVLVWPVEAENGFIKIFYSDVTAASSSDIALRLELDGGEVLTFTMMGRRLPAALKAIKDCREAHMAKLRNAVSTAFAGLAQEKVKALVGLLKEGLAVPLKRLEEVDPSVVRTIEDGISADEELKDTYEFLLERGVPEQVYAGVQVEKFGLDDQEPSFWFLIAQPEGALAMEVTSHRGHATYFFRSGRTEESGDGAARVARELGRALVDLRFRRTPIYLTGDELQKPDNARYAFAARRLPYLHEVRRRFLGRVVHRSTEGWRSSVEELLDWCEKNPDEGRMPSG